MHCFKDNFNNRKYILHFIRLLLTPKSPILPNLGGYRTPEYALYRWYVNVSSSTVVVVCTHLVPG